MAALGMPGLMSFSTPGDLVIGHGSHRYKVDLNWGRLDSGRYPVNDCHEMVQDSKGRIYLLTNHTQNNVLIYDPSGKLLGSWGTEFPGAHGLTISDEGGEEFLYITDTERHEVIKTTLEGRVVLVLPFPQDAGKYADASAYLPTETAIAANGDIYVADGYGSQFVIHYSATGELLNVFGGNGMAQHQLTNAHGICIDARNPNDVHLLVTDRMRQRLNRYSMNGEYLDSIALPGACICRPVIKDQFIYLATIWSGTGAANTGFISILDENNQLISAPGGSVPEYVDGQLQAMQQALRVFKHPHDVCIDKDDNLYVPQWNAGKTYPIKLIRV